MEPEKLDFGNRVRTLRKDLGLSLEQLSSKSGVALATLSRIENGKGAGTFRTHQRIAEAFGLPITDLYQGLEAADQEAVLMESGQEEAAETFTYDEKASTILLTKQISGKQMLPQMVILQPGGSTSLEQYRPGTERWLLVLEGTIDITIGHKSYRVSHGGTLYFKASIPHQMLNTERAAAKAISVTSPAVY